MTRIAFALLAVTSLAVAAPVPKAKKVEPYPTQVGTKWEYVRNGSEKRLWVEEVVESVEKDGVTTFKVDTTTSIGSKEWTRYRVSGGALAVLAWHYAGDPPPDSPAPPVYRDVSWKAGDEFVQKFTIDKSEQQEGVSVGKAEEITTPAGTFTAVPVTRSPVKPAQGQAHTHWYADGVGLVRHTLAGNTTPMMELKSFTPGPK